MDRYCFEGCANLKALSQFTNITFRQDLDRVNKVETFTEMGMSDPFRPEKTLSEAKSYIEGMTLLSIKENCNYNRTPKTVFIPSRKILRIMIRALIMLGNEEKKNDLFMKFGLLDNHFYIMN